MKILILGYSNLCGRKIVPVLKKKFSNVKFSICSRSQKKKNIGAYDWFRDYKVALKKSKPDVVYISSKKDKKDLSTDFNIYIRTGKKTVFGYFNHNGEYENTLTLFTKQKRVTVNRVFSPPNDENLILQVNNDHVKKEKKLKKDDAFLNYLRRIIILLKTKRFENSYQNLLKDSFFREKLIK